MNHVDKPPLAWLAILVFAGALLIAQAFFEYDYYRGRNWEVIASFGADAPFVARHFPAWSFALATVAHLVAIAYTWHNRNRLGRVWWYVVLPATSLAAAALFLFSGYFTTSLERVVYAAAIA